MLHLPVTHAIWNQSINSISDPQNSSIGLYSNQTNPGKLYKSWSVLSSLSIIIFAATIISNTFVLFLILRQKTLQTPFTVYIINLLLANILNGLYQQPLVIAAQLRQSEILGREFCTASIYGAYVIHSAVYNSHFLITLNRIWAVTHPVGYRHAHSKRFAIIACCSSWIYIHLVSLPGVVVDAVFYRVPLDQGCYVTKQPQYTWFVVEQTMLYDVPLVALLLAYPVICFYEFRRRYLRARLIRSGQKIAGDDSDLYRSPESRSNRIEMSPKKEPVECSFRAPKRRSSPAFVVLTLLTVSNCLFLMPLTLAYNLSNFANVNSILVFDVCSLLFYAEAVLDPIFFTLALRHLREAWISFFRL